MNTSCELRDRAVLLAEYRAVVTAELAADAAEFRLFLTGARAALAWVLGRAATTPATRLPKPATSAEMEREERFCDQVIYSGEAVPVLDPDYANGVEHALSWARGAEVEPPTPPEGAPESDRAVCTCG